jgi:hypothetical protein
MANALACTAVELHYRPQGQADLAAAYTRRAAAVADGSDDDELPTRRATLLPAGGGGRQASVAAAAAAGAQLAADAAQSAVLQQACLPAAVWPCHMQHWGQMMTWGALALLDAAALQSVWPLVVFAVFAGLDVLGIVVTSRQSAHL